MEMNYTKGEWKAKRNALGTWTIFTEEGLGEHIGQIDRHFNAKLITAAPLGCKLAELIERTSVKWKCDDGLVEIREDAYNKMSQLALALLAKVEGRICKTS